MKNLIILLCVLAFIGCAPKQTQPVAGNSRTLYAGEYIPLHDPKPLKKFTYDATEIQSGSAGVDYERFMDRYLPLEHITFGTSVIKGNLAFHYLPVSVTSAGENYRSFLEYSKYNTEYIDVWKTTQEGKTLYSLSEQQGAELIAVPVYIGIRICISAEFRSLSGGLNITGFEKLGLAAEASKIAGSLELRKAGMSSKTSSLLLLSPESLSHESIAKAVTSFDKIRSLVYDKDMVITPCILGYYDLEGNEAFNVFAQMTLPKAIAASYSQSDGATTKNAANKDNKAPTFKSPDLGIRLTKPSDIIEEIK